MFVPQFTRMVGTIEPTIQQTPRSASNALEHKLK